MAAPEDPIAEVESALGYHFGSRELLVEALTHCSYANEHPHLAPVDNDRLEFLGDAVLQWAVSALLWETFPEAEAGEMTRRRADLVCAAGLERVARQVGIDRAMLLGKGEERSGGRDKPRLLSSALEACVAAVFLDGGTHAVTALVRGLFCSELERWAPGERDFKTRLQEAVQQRGGDLPRYRVQSVTGPDHEKLFEVALILDREVIATGRGRSKLDAEQRAAQRALEVLADVDQALCE
ncbi:MAG: ribonuclease III [Myxococcales bacterium]|nr:ribonuclease III [Myxococcales bacterium]